MSALPYSIMGGSILAALLAGIIGGGNYWIVPAIILPIIAVYAVVDRRLKQREDESDAAVHDPQGGASGAT